LTGAFCYLIFVKSYECKKITGPQYKIYMNN